MHTGYFRPTASPPPPAIQELCATIRVLPPQDSKPLLSRLLYDAAISKHIHIMIMQSNNSCKCFKSGDSYPFELVCLYILLQNEICVVS
jgi:hypothetical protein